MVKGQSTCLNYSQIGTGQKLQKTSQEEGQTSTGIHFLETSWFKSSYLDKWSAFPRKKQIGQFWDPLEKMEKFLEKPFKTYCHFTKRSDANYRKSSSLLTGHHSRRAQQTEEQHLAAAGSPRDAPVLQTGPDPYGVTHCLERPCSGNNCWRGILTSALLQLPTGTDIAEFILKLYLLPAILICGL